jgi:hypothetical protein
MVHLFFKTWQLLTQCQQFVLSRFTVSCLNEELFRFFREISTKRLDREVNPEHIKLRVNLNVATVL